MLHNHALLLLTHTKRAEYHRARIWRRRSRVTDCPGANNSPLSTGKRAGTVDGEATSCPGLPDNPGLWEDGPLANAEAPRGCFIFTGIPSTASITVSLPSLRAVTMNLPSARSMLR